MKYYICHKLNNYKSETYDEDEDKYKVRNGDATEDKRTAISSEKVVKVLAPLIVLIDVFNKFYM